MKKKRRPSLDVKEWAAGTRRTYGGVACRLCAAAPAVGRDLKTIIEMRQKGETDVSYVQVCAFLREKHGISVIDSSLLRHIRDHLGVKWVK